MEAPDINTPKLRQALEKLSQELSEGFLQKRSKTSGHRQDLLEELRDAVKELTDRERELSAAVGIANMLLDSNELLKAQLITTLNAKREKAHCMKVLGGEVEGLREELRDAEQKYQEVQTVLGSTEEQALIVRGENERLQHEFGWLRDLPGMQQDKMEFYENEIEQLKQEFKEKIDNLHAENNTHSKQNKVLQEKVGKLEEIQRKEYEKNWKIQKDLEKTTISKEKNENEAAELRKALNCTETDLKHLEILHAKALGTVKKLEEELYIAENPTFSQTRTASDFQDQNLMKELESLEEDLPDSLKENSFKRYSCVLMHLANQPGIFIPSKHPGKRKDPIEEYFILSTQSVKMNSPYMDTVCSISTQNLYKKVKMLDIPFHKWHEWITKELNAAYIQMLYQKDLKEQSKQNDQRLVFPF